MTKRLAFMLSLSLVAACAGSGSGEVRYGGSISVRSAELVPVQPDVYVLADADQPIFYTANAYWLYDDARWYRAPRYDGDWVRIATPPRRLREIRQPHAYVRYRARSQTARREYPAQRARPYARDERDYPDVQPRATPPQPPPPAEPVRPDPRRAP